MFECGVAAARIAELLLRDAGALAPVESTADDVAGSSTSATDADDTTALLRGHRAVSDRFIAALCAADSSVSWVVCFLVGCC
jgi:hypothetical protein